MYSRSCACVSVLVWSLEPRAPSLAVCSPTRPISHLKDFDLVGESFTAPGGVFMVMSDAVALLLPFFIGSPELPEMLVSWTLFELLARLTA